MKSDDWKKISDILPDCLELDDFERRRYLDKLDLDPELRAELETFLAFETEAEDFMSATVDGVTKDFFSPSEFDENPSVGQGIGIYKIVREIGFGGMGAVYLAERADGKFEQQVAIKMLKREFNVEKLRQAFRREKEILAKLSHPNIARLLDAGTTVYGVPYLVMEYVKGEPIDKFCEQQNLSVNSRLKLFNKVCDAVSFAHRNLIIHRDLKPSNILVTEKGEPKLLDFGISKLLDGEESTSLTAFGAMTPEYASPEQLKGENVSTATDIYSLGVVLYKTLTDAHPFDLRGKTNGELIRTITEDEPFPPSSVQISNRNPQSSEDTKPISKNQNHKFLKGDIDTIILKSLRKEPERRYQTAEQFSADIWRYIDRMPILARPATVSYRTSKFYRRNKLAVIAASLIFLSLITGIALAIWQADVARRQADFASKMQNRAEKMQGQAELETTRAKSEEEKAKKISQFMFKVISYANPAWYAEGAKYDGNARVLDVLDDLGEKIDTEFAGQADIQAELHHKFGEVYVSVPKRDGESAEDLFNKRQKFHALRALELRKQFYGERHELVAKDLFYAYVIITNDEQERAELLAEAIEMMRETNPNNLNLPYMLEAYAAALMLPDATAGHEIYRKAARPFTDENNYAIAERLLREALPKFRFHYKEDNTAIFMNECRLAYCLAKQENQRDFEEHFAICRQGLVKTQSERVSEIRKESVELVERVLAEKKQAK